MENATKALLIAGGVLLMIMVLSFGTIVIRRMGQQTSEFYEDISDSKIYEFNQQFFNYESNNLRIQDVVSIINLAKDSNKRDGVPVTVNVNFMGSQVDLNSVDTNQMLSDNMTNVETRYTCKVDYADNSEYVGSIIITKN